MQNDSASSTHPFRVTSSETTEGGVAVLSRESTSLDMHVSPATSGRSAQNHTLDFNIPRLTHSCYILQHVARSHPPLWTASALRAQDTSLTLQSARLCPPPWLTCEGGNQNMYTKVLTCTKLTGCRHSVEWHTPTDLRGLHPSNLFLRPPSVCHHSRMRDVRKAPIFAHFFVLFFN